MLSLRHKSVSRGQTNCPFIVSYTVSGTNTSPDSAFFKIGVFVQLKYARDSDSIGDIEAERSRGQRPRPGRVALVFVSLERASLGVGKPRKWERPGDTGQRGGEGCRYSAGAALAFIMSQGRIVAQGSAIIRAEDRWRGCAARAQRRAGLSHELGKRSAGSRSRGIFRLTSRSGGRSGGHTVDDFPGDLIALLMSMLANRWTLERALRTKRRLGHSIRRLVSVDVEAAHCGLAHRQGALGFDNHDHDALLSGGAPGILVLAEVLLGHRVDERLFWILDEVDDLAANLHVAIRIDRIDDRKGDPIVLVQVPELLARSWSG